MLRDGKEVEKPSDLARTNIQREKAFDGCKILGKCINNKDYIEDKKWQIYNDRVRQGENKEVLNKEYSYMICKAAYGIIYFEDAEQQFINHLKKLEKKLRPDTELYNDTLKKVSGITKTDSKFNNDINKFKKVYQKNKNIYAKIAKKVGVPPELIAIIHYREDGVDYLNSSFNVYLHNGERLGKKTEKEPKGKLFYNFEDAAIDAIQDKKNYIKKYKLTSDSKDIVGMMCFAEVYNRLGYYKNGHSSPYLYSGTNQYSSGKYVEKKNKDGKYVSIYEENRVDKQIGAYLLLNSILK